MDAMSGRVLGVLYPAVRPKDIRHYPVPVAPASEQKRVVAEIEKHFTRLDAAVALLKRVQANLKAYRASVLKAAVEGRLMPTEAELARKERRRYESGEELLQRILRERRRRWEADRVAKMRAEGGEPENDEWKHAYREPKAPASADLPTVPEGWVWATAEQLSDETRAITYGVIKLGEHKEDGVPVLRSSDVRHLCLELGEVKRTSRTIAANYKRTSLQGGEVLVTVRGTLGGVCVVPPRCVGFNVSREVAVLSLVEGQLAAVLAMFISSAPTQHWLMKHSRGIAYTGINIGALKELPLPLPPMAEQKRIIAEVERQLSMAKEVAGSTEVQQRRATGLRQAILKLAFEGGLVPQDPTDEPASVLLEHIRVERAATEPERKPWKVRSRTLRRKSKQLPLEV